MLLVAVCFSFTTPASAQRNSLDNQVLVELMENRTHKGTEYQQDISNTTSFISFAVPLSVLTVGLIKNDKTTLKKGLYILESIAVSSLITYSIKYTVNRSRPFNQNPFIIAESSGGGPSFPSGHTSQAFSVATSLFIAFPKWYVAIPAYAWAASVGYSRMYLGVHYPSDVVVGAIVGAGSAWLTHKANQWLRHHKKPAGLLTVY